jgi:hypothetical protein
MNVMDWVFPNEESFTITAESAEAEILLMQKFQ